MSTPEPPPDPLEHLKQALIGLRDQAKSDGGKSARAKAAAQLALEVEDVLRRWSSEVAASELASGESDEKREARNAKNGSSSATQAEGSCE
jgi:hypothetical protein